MEEKKKKKKKKGKKNLKRKKRQEMAASNVTKAGTRNPVYTIQPLSSDSNSGAADGHELPHTKKDWAVSLNLETTPITSTS